jgi:flagellar protein FlaF
MAYSSTNAPIRSHRSIEYDIIAKNSHRIKVAMAKGATGFTDLVAALYENRRLWTMLATSVADSDNELPQPLRAQIFYLAEFTMQHSQKVLDGKATADVLIEINTSVMRGLRQEEAFA